MNTNYTPSTISEIVRYLLSNKIKLILIPLIVGITVALYSLTITNRYTSTANLIPSQRPSLGLDLFSESGGLSSLASSVLGNGETEESNRYIILLTSFTSSKQIVDKFDLISHYEVSKSKVPLLDAIEILESRTKFESREEGNFVISVEDEMPELAKEITDEYINILNNENTRIVAGDANRYRLFLEKRLIKSKSEIDSLRKELVEFQEKYGIIEPTEQAKNYLSLLTTLSAKQIENQIKLRLLEETSSSNNELYRITKLELKVIESKLDEIYNDSNSNNFILNFNEMPDISGRFIELSLEMEIQAEIQKFLVPIYEQAKMEEAKSLPIVSIIDAPRIPQLKSYPSRSLITLSATISTFLFMLIYLIIRLSVLKNKAYFEYLLSK